MAKVMKALHAYQIKGENPVDRNKLFFDHQSTK